MSGKGRVVEVTCGRYMNLEHLSIDKDGFGSCNQEKIFNDHEVKCHARMKIHNQCLAT